MLLLSRSVYNRNLEISVHQIERTLEFKLCTVASKVALSIFNCSHSLQVKYVETAMVSGMRMTEQ